MVRFQSPAAAGSAQNGSVTSSSKFIQRISEEAHIQALCVFCGSTLKAGWKSDFKSAFVRIIVGGKKITIIISPEPGL